MKKVRWVDTLPPADDAGSVLESLELALILLGRGLTYERLGAQDDLLRVVRRVAANLRAQRKTLPFQGGRQSSSSYEDHSDRELLRVAIRLITYVDTRPELSLDLRLAEAALRTLGQRLMLRVPIIAVPSDHGKEI